MPALPKLSFMEVRLPQDNETTLESMSSLFSNFTQFAKHSLWQRLVRTHHTIASLEIVLTEGQIHFYIVTPTANIDFFRSQILAQYPSAVIKEP